MDADSRPHRGRRFLLAAVLLGALSAVEPAVAAEPSWVEAWTAQPYATGGWFGLRDTLDKFGITPTLTYVADFLGNPVGGRRQSAAYAGQLNAEVSVDLGKLGGPKGLTFDISGNWASGTDLSTDDIGNFFLVGQAFAGDRVRLYTLYLEQSLLNGRLDVKVGRFAPGDDFLSWPQYNFLVNIALDPAVYATQVNVPGFTAAPIGTWGARVRAQPFDSFATTAGIYYSDPARDLVNTLGTDFGTSTSGTGYLAVVEFAYFRGQGEGSATLPGTLRFGAYYDSNRYATFDDPAVKHRGNWGLYVLADQVVYREGPPGSGRGLALGGALVVAPDQQINTMPFFAAAGAVYRGLWPGRDKDALAAVAYYGAFSRDLPGQKAETVLELAYSFILAPWLTVQPDIQYVIHPSGRSNVSNALVIGAQIDHVLSGVALALALAVLLALADPALGEEAEGISWVQRWLQQPTMTGNWSGLRDTLGGWGITPTLTYSTDVLANPIGGTRHGLAYAGDLYAAVNLDLAKLIGLAGLSAQVSGSWSTGTNLSNDIGNFFQVAQYFEGDQLRLASLYLRQTLFDGRLELKAGRFATGDDFLTTPLGVNLVNEALNPIVLAVQANVPGVTAYPNSTWGGGRVIARTAEAVSLLAGAYYSDPFLNPLDASGTEFAINSRAGYFAVGEAVLRVNGEAGASGLPGRYRVAATMTPISTPSWRIPGVGSVATMGSSCSASRCHQGGRVGDGAGPVPLRRFRLGPAPAHQYALLRVGGRELPGASSGPQKGRGGVRPLLRGIQPRPPGPDSRGHPRVDLCHRRHPLAHRAA